MTDDEFLEKVCDVAEKWSKPYLAAVGGYFLSAIVIAWNVTDWFIANARDNLGALIAFGIGGILTGAVLASLFWRHVLKKSVDAKDGAVKKRISDELSSTKGLERVNDLDSLIEMARDLALLQEQLAAKDAEIAELEKRPTQEKVNEFNAQLRAKDVEISALKDARMPTRLDIAKSALGDEGLRAFGALCAASTYVDGDPSRPLVFSMDDDKLSAIGLDRSSLLLMEEAGVIRLSEEDERELVGSQARKEPTDIGCGVTACADFVRFDLAGGRSVEVKPVRLTWGTDIYVATGLYGADLGIASFTSLGSELAAEYAALNPPLGIVGYIEDAYSAELRESRHHFRYLSKDGELVAPR